VSPRSEEFLEQARERIRAAHASLAAGFPSVAVSAAYYGMLYAARAALSEEERNAKTHRGVWRLFGELFVSTGRLDRDVFLAARRTRELREAADYEAREVSPEQARELVAAAETFVARTAAMLAG
jgi:uncharacterized protein (UPF0332 family)